MNLVALAGSLPRNPRFREWVAKFVVSSRAASAHEEVGVEEAARYIRDICQVKSRREIGESKGTEARFHYYIRIPFTEWCEQQKQTV